jgi:hypothetical protein
MFEPRPDSSRRHEPYPISQSQRARSVSLPQGRTRAPTDPARQSDRGVAAASVATNAMNEESKRWIEVGFVQSFGRSNAAGR